MEAGLVKRLETAVSRLELMASQQKPGLAPKPVISNSNATTNPSEPPAMVKQYDECMEHELNSFYDLCTQLEGNVAEMGMKLKLVMDAHRAFLWYAAGHPEPSDPSVLESKLAPIVSQVLQMAAFKESMKNTPLFNHLSAVAEGVQAVSWVNVEFKKPTPAPFVKEMFDCSMFFVNRVRTNNKDKKLHTDWCNAWCSIFTALQKYIRQHHTIGLVWNSTPGAEPPDPISASQPMRVIKSTGHFNAPAPPPPPPPPAGLLAADKADAGSDRAALFAQINKGEAVTSGLKKVTADMQTHKNPNLRGSSTVGAVQPGKPSSPASGAKSSPAAGKVPKIELRDKKVWEVGFQRNNDNIIIEAKMEHAVYIYSCENSVVQIKGKVNSITMDGCKKSSVVFDDLLAQVEIINCQGAKVQALGTMPTISIQKTDGCQVFLSKESLNAEIITSKSSEMNVSVPHGEDGEFVEYPVPEQFKTTIDVSKKRLDTVVSDIV